MFLARYIRNCFALILVLLISISSSQEEPTPVMAYVAFVVWALNVVFFVLLMQNQSELKRYDSKIYTPTIWYVVVGLFFFTCILSVISLIMIIIHNYNIKTKLESFQHRKNLVYPTTQYRSNQSFTNNGKNDYIVRPPLPNSLNDITNQELRTVLSNNVEYRPQDNNVEYRPQDNNVDYVLKYNEKDNFAEYFFDKNINGEFVEKVYVNQYQKVNEGDKILTIRIWKNGKNHYITFFARHNGWIVFKKFFAEAYTLHFSQYSDFMLIYNNEDSLIKTHFFDKVVLKEDLFTKRPVIIGEKCRGSIDGFKFGPFLAYLEYNSGKHRFNLLYGGRTFYLYRSQSLVLLMESGRLITLDKFFKPTNNNNEIYTQKTYCVISYEDVKILGCDNVIKFRVLNSDGTIELECDPFDKDKNDSIIQKAFKDYINKYISLFMSIDPADYESQEVDKEDKQEKKCYVYLMKDTTNLYYKIGISNKPKYRERTLQSEKPTIELICSKQFPSRKIAESFEKALHHTYESKRIRGEWFKLEEHDIQELIETLNN